MNVITNMDKEEMRRTDNTGRDAWTTMVSREGSQGRRALEAAYAMWKAGEEGISLLKIIYKQNNFKRQMDKGTVKK